MPMRDFTHFIAHLNRFQREERGSVVTMFAVAALPVLIMIGVAVDYSRAISAKGHLQSAIDASVFAAAQSNSTTVATNLFNAEQQFKGATIGTPSYTPNADGSLTGTATGTVPTAFLGIIGVNSVAFKATATVAGLSAGGSGSGGSGNGYAADCILALGSGTSTATSNSAITLNGAPVMNLRGCSLYSNQSMNCHGHNGNAKSSIAVGTADSCSNPIAGAARAPDIYAPIASNITAKCGASTTGVNWAAAASPGAPPSSMIAVTRTGYNEYHVCGDLNLSGTGSLTGTSPTTDTVIVIENGSINMANNATISANRMTFVFTGSDLYNHTINFPNGQGHLATLNLEPSISTSNPWAGISLYQDPVVTKNVNVKLNDIYSVDDMIWGPGGAMNMDGVIYLPNADVTVSGNAGSGNTPCTVVVVATLTTNGSVNLNFQQSVDNCTALGVKQFSTRRALKQ